MYRPPPHPMDEEGRLQALRSYRILDTEPEAQYDRIAENARRQFDVPIALVAFMDAERNFFKARCDLPMTEAPRSVSFCAHTILKDDVLVVPDARADRRFAENPLVVEDPKIRFYAGAPLATPSGHCIGTVCVLDTEPRHDFGEREKAHLADLAAITSDHLAMRLIVGNVHDEIETRRAAEAEAQRLAQHDALTGLPNRAFVQAVMRDGLPFRVKGVLAAICADLDQFKSVNDALGHHAGDEFLKQTAETIRAAIGGRGIVARISGDEFVALLDGESRSAVETIAAALVEATKGPLALHGHRVATGLSIGVAFADKPDADIAALLRNADLAVYEAKRLGRRRFVTFEPQMAVNADRRIRLERDLGAALTEGRIDVHYQPIHAATDRTMVGVEALARWQHHEFGAVSPVEFVGVAEETGQILQLGEHILKTALVDAAGWGEVFVSVNLSPVQFRLPDLADRIADILKETGFPAKRLQLEVTEGVFLDDVEAAKLQMEALHRLGARLALDDFGTGYSSLGYLRSLPLDKIKIDRSFVHGIGNDKTNYAIVQYIAGLARELNMRVTAEGVETESEATLLRAAGCTTLQGFYFAKPMPARELARRLKRARRAA